MVARRRANVEPVPDALPALRFEISEAALMIRMSRAQIYTRIRERSIKPQKDGARTYITRAELERYVESCNSPSEHDHTQEVPCGPGRRTGTEQADRGATLPQKIDGISRAALPGAPRRTRGSGCKRSQTSPPAGALSSSRVPRDSRKLGAKSYANGASLRTRS